MKDALDWILKLKIVPQGWLTVLAGFGTFLTGLASVICHFAGCRETLPFDVALGFVGGGLVAVGFGRRGAKPAAMILLCFGLLGALTACDHRNDGDGCDPNIEVVTLGHALPPCPPEPPPPPPCDRAHGHGCD